MIPGLCLISGTLFNLLSNVEGCSEARNKGTLQSCSLLEGTHKGVVLRGIYDYIVS